MSDPGTGELAPSQFVRGLGWKAGGLTEAELLHPSVRQRIDGVAGSSKYYQPRVEM